MNREVLEIDAPNRFGRVGSCTAALPNPEPISRRNVVGLVIAPYIHSGVPEPTREFFGEDVEELFESADARLALNLVPATRVSAAGRTDDTTAAEARGLGRNAPCWCGSGKKFKKCHGA